MPHPYVNWHAIFLTADLFAASVGIAATMEAAIEWRKVVAWARTSGKLKMWTLGWISLAEALVLILSGGRLAPGWRAGLLFSGWFEG